MSVTSAADLNIDETLHVYEASARTTDTYGRMVAKARYHHVVADGPPALGCPGEAIMPGELFLAAMATCSVELMQVFAQAEGLPLEEASVAIRGEIDLTRQRREGVTLFTSIGLEIDLAGVDQDQAEHLVGLFKGLCPIYGSVSVATDDIQTEVRVSR